MSFDGVQGISFQLPCRLHLKTVSERKCLAAASSSPAHSCSSPFRKDGNMLPIPNALTVLFSKVREYSGEDGEQKGKLRYWCRCGERR